MRYCMWTPRGTFLLLMFAEGVALLGTSNFEMIRKFPHRNVLSVDVSPCESYLVTL